MTAATSYTALHGRWMTRASATSVMAASTSALPMRNGFSTTSTPVMPSWLPTPAAAPTPGTTALTTGSSSSWQRAVTISPSPARASSVGEDWRSKFRSTSFPDVMFSVAGAAARSIAPFLIFLAVAGMGFLADPAPVDRAPVVRLADDANPLAGMPFYVNPTSAAMRAAQHAHPPSPELTAVANTPQAYWIIPGSSASTVAKYTADAAAAGALPVFTVYGIPHRDCGSFAAGGIGSGDAYRGWI